MAEKRPPCPVNPCNNRYGNSTVVEKQISLFLQRCEFQMGNLEYSGYYCGVVDWAESLTTSRLSHSSSSSFHNRL